jgi:HEPN domain-containing protein
MRIADARVLLRARRYAAAYYMCGYAVECALKACIARQTRSSDFPDLNKVRDSWTHNLSALVKVAGLDADRTREESADPIFKRYWATTQGWSESSRYERRTGAEARDLFTAITDGRHGVLRWVRKHW